MPDLPADMTLDRLSAWARKAHPELEGARFSVLADGWDSVALDVDDRLILKFPRHQLGAEGLRREAAVLAVIRQFVQLPVPDIRLFETPVLHSMHAKLPGVLLLPEVYAGLDEDQRAGLGEALGKFFAQLHAIDKDKFHALGMGEADAWLDAASIRQCAWRHLPEPMRPWADRALNAWADLPPDPYGVTYGHFDAHGWNMAFNPATGQLSGVFDFGDSGFASLHREFVYSTLIDLDLTLRVIAAYERHSGRAIDRERVLLLADIHRLWEIAIEHEDAASVAGMLVEVEHWARVRATGARR